MTSFIPAAKNLAAFVGAWTCISEMNTAVSYMPLKELLNPHKQFFDPNAPAPSLSQRAWSVICSGTRVVGALCLYLVSPLPNIWSINMLINVVLKSPVKRCSNTQIALVATTCLALYAGIKRYVSEESRSGFFASRTAEAIGKGALIGMLAQFKPYLALASLYVLALTNYYQTRQADDKKSITIILDEKNAICLEKIQNLRRNIARLFGKDTFSQDEGSEILPKDTLLSQVAATDPQVLGAMRGNLSEEDFLRLLPPDQITHWSELSFDEKINMAFLTTGIYIFVTQHDGKIPKEEWLKQFTALCQEGASLQKRKQLALDYLRDY